jgi:hypothetical protein
MTTLGGAMAWPLLDLTEMWGQLHLGGEQGRSSLIKKFKCGLFLCLP